MRVIAVRTDKPVYASNVYGGGVITVTATVQVNPGESGMYKLQAYIKRFDDPSNAWQTAGYEQWGKPSTVCMTGITSVKTNCGDDVQINIASPVGFGKHIITVINRNEMDTTPGATIDDMVRATGAFATFEVLPMSQTAYGLLQIVSSPAQAAITIDGIPSDRSTATGASQNFSLPAGSHSVTISKMGYATYRQDVVVPPRESVQVYAKLVPASLTGAGTSYAAHGTPYAAWDDEYNLLPQRTQPPNPMYKPDEPMVGGMYAVTSANPAETATSSLAGVANAIAQYTPYLILLAGGAVFLYAMSKPTIRKKATEYAARGGVAARAGLGGVKDVARAGYRGLKSRRVEGMRNEQIEYLLREAAAKRGIQPDVPREDIERTFSWQNIPGESWERPSKDLPLIPNGSRNGSRNGKARKVTLTMEE
jgi:hypothetical protein